MSISTDFLTKLQNSGCVQLFKPHWKYPRIMSIQVKGIKLVITNGVIRDKLYCEESSYSSRKAAVAEAIKLINKKRLDGYGFKKFEDIHSIHLKLLSVYELNEYFDTDNDHS